MIRECEDAGWITVKRNKHNYRRVRAAKVLVDQWISGSNSRRLLRNPNSWLLIPLGYYPKWIVCLDPKTSQTNGHCRDSKKYHIFSHIHIGGMV